jgi:hypothetical protein
MSNISKSSLNLLMEEVYLKGKLNSLNKDIINENLKNREILDLKNEPFIEDLELIKYYNLIGIFLSDKYFFASNIV